MKLSSKKGSLVIKDNGDMVIEACVEDRLKALENRVDMLETENKQLRNGLMQYVDMKTTMAEKKAESYLNG